MSHDFLFKFILTGDSSVGKTSLLQRFADQEFRFECEATIGIDFKTKNVQVEDKEILIMIWDTAGQETYRSFTRSYYRGSAVAILVYDITNKTSFANIPGWLADIKNNCPNPNLVLVLVGNKKDAGVAVRQVSEEEGHSFANKHGLLFFETSAKCNENVDKLFTIAAAEFYEKFKEGLIDFRSDSQGLTLGPKQISGGRGKCSC